MNYPFWEVPAIGGGFLIALISIIHVYIAHLAVGGGLFLVWTERKARRESNADLLAYVRKHTHFFLLLTMVAGGVTGVGIWFIIALVHPAGTSTLIHNFVFGWAIEWTFFIGEIACLLVYYYLWDRLAPRVHLTIGWLYFLFAWLSLFIINGILTFQLTPGAWLETGDFWHGFFNPTAFPSLVFRSGIAFTVAGLFGLLTALFTAQGPFRTALTRYCARWMLLPFALVVLGGFWYVASIPEEPLANIRRWNPEGHPYVQLFAWTSVIIFGGGLVSLIRAPRNLHRVLSVLLIVIGLGWLAGFEYVREIARKPYVIFDHLYSNSVTVTKAETLAAEGFLPHARWARAHAVDPDDPVPAGRELLVHQCLICHTLGGRNDLLARTAHYDEFAMAMQLNGQGKVKTYMPPFFGTREERDALAAYVIRELHGRPPTAASAVEEPEPEATPVPEFDPRRDDFVLLAWNDLGMHCLTDADRRFVLLPPANTLWAQLIRRGTRPELVTEGVKLTYAVEAGYEHPERHVPFWEFVQQTFGVELTPPTGLFGKQLTGTLDPRPEHKAHVAAAIPVVPYRDREVLTDEQDVFHPYPLFTIEARDASGKLLAQTQVVAPVSSEMGCKNCHGGGWRVSERAGMSDDTARDILRVHDRSNGTELLAEAELGRPRLCQSCHADPALAAAGDPARLNLSTAVHGFHANYLPGMDAAACVLCHPAREDGATRCLRGRHGQAGVTCTECHGAIEDHALSLLKHELAAGKAEAARLMSNLVPQHAADAEQIAAREPWVNEPDCLNCHEDFELGDIDAFNLWTSGADALYRNRADCRGVMCAACHGSPHAVYPALNAYGEDRDNIQPLQYQGIAGSIATEGNCGVCHRESLAVDGHHRRMAHR
jgi:mono/diheme cytochrome c family protein